jgi:hypothetical protein
VFQDRGVDAIGAADVEGGKSPAVACCPLGFDDGAEDRLGSGRDAIVEIGESLVVATRIGPIVDAVEVDLTGVVQVEIRLR